MIDDVAKAICAAAGRPLNGAPECQFCEDDVCQYWETFKDEAKAAIIAAYRWHKRERRWPSFTGKPD